MVDSQDGSPLVDAFITFSSGKTILRGQTDHDGKLKFSNVVPQKYYLTAIKKEYTFGTQDQVEVKEEEHKKIKLSGQRIAFSVYGSVSTLNGVPITNGNVVARSGDNVEIATIQEPKG